MFNSIQFNAGKFNATNKNPAGYLKTLTDTVTHTDKVIKKPY